MSHLIDRRDFLKTGVKLVGTGILSSCCKFDDNFSKILKLEKKVDKYSMGFVLVVKDKSELTTKLVDRFEEVKNAFSRNFDIATRGMASMDVSNPTSYLIADESLVSNPHATNPSAITKNFFQNNSDEFDFLSIYSDFDTKGGMCHYNLKNNLQGIGLGICDKNEAWTGKKLKRLLGVNYMRNIHNLSDFGIITHGSSIFDRVNSWDLLHETGHQWGVYVGDNFSGKNKMLEIKQQGIHFYRGLDSPNDNCTPMGADHWVLNEQGGFKRVNNNNVLKLYHPFQLYFMGLLPESEYSEKFKIYNAGTMENFYPKHAVPYGEVSVKDIIDVVGYRKEVGKTG